nr:hypothetical protein [Tanacetum cinerariifolium]
MSSRVPVPLPDDPYVAVRQAQLANTDTELEPEETPSEAEESQPLGSRVPFMSDEFEGFEPSSTRTISSYSSVSLDSTSPLSSDHPLTHALPTRVSFHRRTARMVVRTQPTLSPGMSARIVEAVALSTSSFRKRTARMVVRTQPTLSSGMSARIVKAVALSTSSFRKRYRSTYETPSPSSSPTLPVRKRYRGTSELIEDTKGESSELDSERKGSEDESLDSDEEREGRGLDDEGHGLDDEGQGLDDKGQGLDDEGHGLDDEVKENQEKDKIGTKSDKNEKRGEAGKIQK